ncbi:YoaK family protein [Aldersonia kunmingensis]|uniref:YoaK family protein n=1 Tax=Aldersonia kunmingensis TaxID=408066 RepID=UPI000837747F|nr:YoaK family protein [Aldersonia kunmingensis]
MTTQTTTSLRFAVLLTLCGGFMDAYTYIARGGVFANAQTGNVVLLGVDLSESKWHAASQHLWPILAFIAGVAFAAYIKSERAHRWDENPVRWAIWLQAIVLFIVGFVPDSVPNAFATIPIAFVAAMQIGLFRQVGDLAYLAIVTSGNLMRLTEAGYAALVDHDDEQWFAVRVYGAIVTTFAIGAVGGAVATSAWHERAAWIPAGLLGATLVLIFVDNRVRRDRQAS